MSMPSRASARAQRSRSQIEYSFRPSNLFSDPFAISSISICFLSWIIAFVGCITTASGNQSFPRFTWWGIVYELMILCMMITFYCFNVVDYYKTFLTGAFAVAFIYTTNSATILVYGDGSKKAAASAGVILLSIVNLIWIFYFGSDNGSPTNRWIDSFSLRGIRPSPYEDAFLRARRRSVGRALQSGPKSNRYTSDNFYPENLPQNYVSSTALAGFENTDPAYSSNVQVNNADNNAGNTFVTDSTNANTDTTMSGTLELYSDAGDESFPYTAKTLYSYQADAGDAYEISFEQGEILKVSDIEGRWWKAKRANGETGIIPSNYVQLVDNDVL
ncbi:hypothetical protein HG537_0B04400 [Torulaspora globosa]|uniref:High osmolarity signaling protein SHO1 n=1 Tax=Torulaspora globosa TaxID=48254 RepID=A0A7H9HRX6_9SACH|nr:hypothetical protein HG537_0B04400 [Torulaspora sp. CBS 2947]